MDRILTVRIKSKYIRDNCYWILTDYYDHCFIVTKRDYKRIKHNLVHIFQIRIMGNYAMILNVFGTY